MKPTLPEPETIDKHIPTGVVIRGYTAKTVQRLIDEAYAAGLEDAAKVCDEISIEAAKQWKERYRPFDQGREHGADECAEAIRSLKPKGEA